MMTVKVGLRMIFAQVWNQRVIKKVKSVRKSESISEKDVNSRSTFEIRLNTLQPSLIFAPKSAFAEKMILIFLSFLFSSVFSERMHNLNRGHVYWGH